MTALSGLCVVELCGERGAFAGKLFAFDQALYSEKLLTRESIAKLFTPVTENYGYGWEVYMKTFPKVAETVKVVGHAGSTFGFHSSLVRAPDQRHLVVVLSNTQPAKVRELSDKLMMLLYSKEASKTGQ